jgi:hypothetical protein
VKGVSIPAERLREIGNRVLAPAPRAVGGLLLGRIEADEIRITRGLPCPNYARAGLAADRFELDPSVVPSVRRSLSNTGEAVVGFFHSAAVVLDGILSGAGDSGVLSLTLRKGNEGWSPIFRWRAAGSDGYLLLPFREVPMTATRISCPE